MPRVHHVKANKDYPNEGIKKGDMYYTWSIKLQRGGIKYRSLKQPRPSQLTRSDFRQPLLSTMEAFQDALDAASCCEDLRTAVEECVGELENIMEETQGKFDNMPEGLQQGETGQLIEGRVNSVQELIDELQAVDIPDDPEEKEGSEDEEEQEANEEAKEEAKNAYEAARDELQGIDYQGE